MKRYGIQRVQLPASMPLGNDEVGRLEDIEVLRDCLPRHVEVDAQLRQRLPVALMQPIEQRPAAGIGEGSENGVGVFHRVAE